MKNNEREQYEALLTEESDLENPQQRLINKPSSSFWDLDKKLVLILLLSLSNFIFFTLWILQSTQCHYPDAQILYSPVRDILEYEVITFNATDGRNRHPDPWSQPLSDELDEAWEGLYNDSEIAFGTYKKHPESSRTSPEHIFRSKMKSIFALLATVVALVVASPAPIQTTMPFYARRLMGVPLKEELKLLGILAEGSAIYFVYTHTTEHLWWCDDRLSATSSQQKPAAPEMRSIFVLLATIVTLILAAPAPNIEVRRRGIEKSKLNTV
uniref:Uncharacterized protein n=1 Tax=Moniliophthora roreri TaxID=221103 RepID=A0A0W0G306_MONRR